MPFFAVMYRLFRSPDVAGTRNSLLAHDLLGAPLGAHWLTAPGPLAAGLYLLTMTAWTMTERLMLRRAVAAPRSRPQAA
ncbi:MAG: hypothetical protein ACLP52_23020 [Streptosporangiaceae bacterium]